MFLYCYSPCSNYLLAQAPQAKLLSSFEMTPLNTYQYPCSSGLLVSSKAFGKPLVELKTLGWEHSKKNFENDFENLGVVSTPLNCSQKWFWTIKVGHGGKTSGGFKRKDIGDYIFTRDN
jgi:hypothetical protein